MIKDIHIKNFKCHKSLRTGLGLGITLFVAPNGKGKSTVAEAIAWCLFGPHAINASQDRIVTHGETECKVQVIMMIGDEEPAPTRLVAALRLMSMLVANSWDMDLPGLQSI